MPVRGLLSSTALYAETRAQRGDFNSLGNTHTTRFVSNFLAVNYLGSTSPGQEEPLSPPTGAVQRHNLPKIGCFVKQEQKNHTEPHRYPPPPSTAVRNITIKGNFSPGKSSYVHNIKEQAVMRKDLGF